MQQIATMTSLSKTAMLGLKNIKGQHQKQVSHSWPKETSLLTICCSWIGVERPSAWKGPDPIRANRSKDRLHLDTNQSYSVITHQQHCTIQSSLIKGGNSWHAQYTGIGEWYMVLMNMLQWCYERREGGRNILGYGRFCYMSLRSAFGGDHNAYPYAWSLESKCNHNMWSSSSKAMWQPSVTTAILIWCLHTTTWLWNP